MFVPWHLKRRKKYGHFRRSCLLCVVHREPTLSRTDVGLFIKVNNLLVLGGSSIVKTFNHLSFQLLAETSNPVF